MGDELGVPDEWSKISRQVERFVARFFRGNADVDGDDVVQESLLQLLRRCRADPGVNLEALAVVIARRRCIDALRRAYVSRRVLAEDLEPPSLRDGVPRADDSAERSEVRSLLLGVRGRLSGRCRALLDQLLLGWRLADVARGFGTTAGAMRNRWLYCRRQIQEVVAAWGFRREDLVG